MRSCLFQLIMFNFNVAVDVPCIYLRCFSCKHANKKQAKKSSCLVNASKSKDIRKYFGTTSTVKCDVAKGIKNAIETDWKRYVVILCFRKLKKIKSTWINFCSWPHYGRFRMLFLRSFVKIVKTVLRCLLKLWSEFENLIWTYFYIIGTSFTK